MKHHNGFRRINNCDGGKGRARRAYHKACRIRYEVWQVEEDEFGTTWVERVDAKPTEDEAREAAREYQNILWKFENVWVGVSVREA